MLELTLEDHAKLMHRPVSEAIRKRALESLKSGARFKTIEILP